MHCGKIDNQVGLKKTSKVQHRPRRIRIEHVVLLENFKANIIVKTIQSTQSGPLVAC